MTAPLPLNESERLKALEALKILDTPSEARYDDLVELAASICDVPIALMTLVDKDRQWFKAKVGLDAQETSRELAFCAYCILDEGLLEVSDASKDDRFKNNLLVTEDPNIRFYAGAPLITSEGHALGSLCVISPEPKTLTASQKKALTTLSKQVSNQLELRLANQRLATSTEQLSQSNDSLKQLVRIISHDLRSPFQGIIGITELLEESYDTLTNDEVAHFLSLLYTSVNETYNLLENLLEWSTIAVGSHAYTPSTISAAELVDKSVRVLSTAIQKKDISFVKKIDPAITIHADSKMISSVIRNLVGNAIKFTPKQGRIELSGSIEKDRLKITILDNGIGLNPEQLRQIRHTGDINSSVGTEGEHGSGIGLHLVHEFLKHHDSALQIQSDASTGTAASFSVDLK